MIPQALVDREVSHDGLSSLRVVSSMHERKALMSELSDAFIALPGGFGTIEELCETLTWAQLGLHGKPLALLNVEGYFDAFLSFLDHAVEERFVHAAHRRLVFEESDPEMALTRFRSYVPPTVEKWLDAEEA